MRECWWIYHSLACRVMGVQHYPPETLTRWEERQLFRQVMQDKPRHWGRFVAYVDRLDQQYSPDQAYEYFRNIQEDMPQLVPTPWTFVLQCLVYLVTRACCQPLDSAHGSSKEEEKESIRAYSSSLSSTSKQGHFRRSKTLCTSPTSSFKTGPSSSRTGCGLHVTQTDASHFSYVESASHGQRLAMGRRSGGHAKVEQVQPGKQVFIDRHRRFFALCLGATRARQVGP